MYNDIKELDKRYVSIKHIFFIALIVLSLATMIIVVILNNYHIKEVYIKNFEKKYINVKNDIDLILNSKMIITKLISNRTRIYQNLEEFNNGTISIEYLRDFTIPKLKDSFTADKSIVAVKRFDINNKPVVVVGDIFPSQKINFNVKKVSFSSIFIDKGEFYLPIVSPINNRKGKRVGTDLIIFKLTDITSVLSEKKNGDKQLFNIVLKEHKNCFKILKDNFYFKNIKFQNKGKLYLKYNDKKYLMFYSELSIPKTYIYGAYNIGFLNKEVMSRTIKIGVLVFLILLIFNFIVYFFIILKQKKIFKKAEEFIGGKIEEKELLNKYLDLSPEIFVVLDKKGNIRYLNKKGYEILEIEDEDIIGKNWFDNFIPEEVRDKVKSLFNALRMKNFDKFKNYDNEIITLKNNVKFIRWNNSMIDNGKGRVKYIIATGTDITLQKKKEEEIRLLNTAAEQAPVSVVITDNTGNIEYVNPFFCKLTGYSFDEAVGKNPRILKSGEHSEAFYKNLWETITSGETWTGEFHNKKKNGELYWEKAVIGPVIDNKGKISHFVGIKEDITELKEIREYFYNIQKLESLGTLAGGIAHDMNNILYAIGGYIEILDRKLENENHKKYIDSIKKSVERAKNLVSQILSFSRHDIHKDKEIIDFENILKESIKFIKDIIPSFITIDIIYNSQYKFVFANKTKINQIIMNLLTNARDAIGNKHGEIKIMVEDIDKDTITKSYLIEKEYENYIKLSVSDNGAGIPEEIKEKIFDPFFTTKEKGKGTGLGLSTVYRIVKNLDAIIDVDSKVGEGTTFTIYLPAFNMKERKQKKKKKIKPEDLKGKERILFVDDEEQVVDAIGEGLKDFGYDVVGIKDSYEALNLFKNNPNMFDVVITDQTMPKLSGKELGEELLKIRKDIPIILCTGYSDSIDREKAIEIGFKEFVIKPITSVKLALIIREILTKQTK